MIELDDKFKKNFDSWTELSENNLSKTFIGLQCVAGVGEILNSKKSSKHHSICCSVYDEIFSDGVLAVYLASNAMNKPANIVLRRILELGVAAIYLWDMPHEVYSWNNYDQDLNFSAMLTHLNSKGYLAYISEEYAIPIESDIFPASKCQQIYGELSDVVHGKITTFESSLPDRFVFAEHDWRTFINLMEEVLDILIEAYLLRYQISTELFQKVPLAKKEFN